MNENTRANDPVMEWLGAYLDGELAGPRLEWVEAHLATCPDCQSELEGLRALTSLLQADPEPAPAQDTAAFAAGVLRGLEGRGQRRGGRLLRAGLRYTPLGLFGAWAFTQAAILVAGALMFGLSYLPGLQPLLGWLLPSGGSSSGFLRGWLADPLAEMGFSGLIETLDLLQRLPWIGTLGLASLISVALLAALFSAWLAGYWSHCRFEQCG